MSNPLITLFKNSRTVGVVGDAGTGKSSCVLHHLIDLKKRFNIPVHVLGAEASLHTYLSSKGINILYSSEDILDLKIRDSVVYIDEFAEIFDVRMQSKQGTKIKKFFNRIEHLNNYVVVSSAEVNFWNSFMCSLIQAYIVKGIEFSHLVRGTDLKRKVCAITRNTSDYRLELQPEEYYVITAKNPVEHCTFEYSSELNSKSGNHNPFLDLELNLEPKLELNPEKEIGDLIP